MTTCGGPLVRIEDVFEEELGGECFVVSIAESDERRHSLGGE